MEENQEQKHICKFCKKSFPCGRSLGGHMRSHMTVNSADTDEKLYKKKVASVNDGSNSNSFMGFEAGGHAGYGLRENPKKTWRLSDSSDGALHQGKTCKECGKRFQSWKALFGHMRCHSERGGVSNSLEDDSWTGGDEKLVMDSQSDNEAAAPRRRRRSRRMRYTTTTTTSSSFSFANASSSVSEIDHEQEEVAMCLIMLSRDVGHWGGFNSVAESSDNNSVVLEAITRSSGLENKGISGKRGRDFFCDGDETVKMKKPRDRKLESVVSDSENVWFEKKRSEVRGTDSGFLRDGVKKVESEVSDDEFLRDGLKKTKLENEAGFEVPDVKLGKNSYNSNRRNRKNSTLDCSEAELGKDLIKEAKMDRADSESIKHNSSKRTSNGAHNPELGEESSKKIRYDASDSEFYRDTGKGSRYECTTCNKIFHSYQALGGHRASHTKVKGCFASRIESSENSIETDVTPDPMVDSKLTKSPMSDSELVKSSSNEKLDRAGSAEASNGSKKSKVHVCPICFKVFASGQALGGHKRSHLVGGSESRGNKTIVIEQQLPEIHDLLDLNLPAPIDEETSGHRGFKPWWVGSNHKHEPLVGLISN